MGAATPGSDAGRALFRSLIELGLDRRRFSIHEMLTDILELVAVAEGLKPAQLCGHGERADWQIDAFERLAAGAGLCTRRTPPLPPPPGRFAILAGEFPLFAAAMAEREAVPAAPGVAPEVLWISRDDAAAGGIERLLAGDRESFPAVLGYPVCCVADDARRDLHSVRALLRLYERQHGVAGEAAVLAAIAAGVAVAGDPAASVELAAVWRTRLVYPWLGFTACPDCLAAADSPAAEINAAMRRLAFALDPAFARALWQAARGEAALATRGDFRALDPAPDDTCPCGSGASFVECCAGAEFSLPAFR